VNSYANGIRRAETNISVDLPHPPAKATDGEGAHSPAKRWWPAVLSYTDAYDAFSISDHPASNKRVINESI
jgi:hypothetical protein